MSITTSTRVDGGREMGTTIRQVFTTGAGTTIAADKAGGLDISHGSDAGGLRQKAQAIDDAVRADKWKDAERLLGELEKQAEPVALDTLSKPDKRYLLGALMNAADTARQEERWSFLEIVLS